VNVKAVPEGYHSVTPYAVVEGADQMIQFLKTVFGAEETVRLPGANGKVGHAEVRIGDALVMLADWGPQNKAFPAMLHIYVDDSDAAYHRALAAGATSLREPTLEFYGDRMSGVTDAFGNQYWIATHVEDVSEEEMARRAKELASSAAPT
jgi:PhnB protein